MSMHAFRALRRVIVDAPCRSSTEGPKPRSATQELEGKVTRSTSARVPTCACCMLWCRRESDEADPMSIHVSMHIFIRMSILTGVEPDEGEHEAQAAGVGA